MSAPSSWLMITLDSLLAQGLPVWSTFHVTVWMGNYHPLLLNPYLYIRVSGSRRSGLLVLRVVGRYNERGKCLVHYRGHCTLFCWMFFLHKALQSAYLLKLLQRGRLPFSILPKLKGGVCKARRKRGERRGKKWSKI